MSLENVSKIEALENEQGRISYLVNDCKSVTAEYKYSGSRLHSLPSCDSRVFCYPFVENYALVLLANNKYGYINQKDHLASQGYDVASSFLNGYAIVGKAGFVTVIDRCFQYLDQSLGFTYPGTEEDLINFGGFSKAEVLLKSKSGLIKITNKKGQVFFFNPLTNKVQTFFRLLAKGNIQTFISEEFIHDFDENGIAYTENSTIFLESGFYFTLEDLQKLSISVETASALYRYVPKNHIK